MSLEKKLKRWVDNELILPEQADGILYFEKKGNSKNLGQVLYVFAGILIGFGICLIVGANWNDIPDVMKFLLDFSIAGTFVWYAFKNIEAKKKGLLELFLVLSFLMIGATIGLAGQVFHLDGGWSSFAFFWSIIGIPFVFYSRSMFLNFSWLVLFLHFFALECVAEHLKNFWMWFSELKFFQKELLLYVLLVLIFYSLSFGLKKLDQKVNKYTILPYYCSKLSLFLSYIYLFEIGELGLRWGLFSRFDCWFSVVLFLGAVGYRMRLGIKHKDVAIFKHNTVLAELYIFALFAVKIENLLVSGVGFIFMGLFVLGILYLLKKTNLRIKKMEAFK